MAHSFAVSLMAIGGSGKAGRMQERFYGKYRGVVVSTADPMMRRRLKVQVPEILGESMPWALSSLPLTGGDTLKLEDGADVWVEFEAGDPDFPICTGRIG